MVQSHLMILSFLHLTGLLLWLSPEWGCSGLLQS